MCEAPAAPRRAVRGSADDGAVAPARDVDVVTTGGRRRIPAHSSVLASASPVLGSILERRRKKDRESGKTGARAVIRIRGVTDHAAAAFVRLLSAGSDGAAEDESEDLEKYAVQVLALAHAYQVPWLKRACEGAIGARLTADSAVDVLQLAALCDAPRLHLRCTRLLAKEFAAIERTEAWRFLQENDPWQELDLLQRLHDADLRRRRWRRKRAEQRVYMELSEAMDCLAHICTEGCTDVGPAGRAPAAAPCPRYDTACRGLQQLIRHFSKCHRRSCARCQRTWQLLRLHAAICDHPDRCNTPLCKRFKTEEQERVAAKAAGGGDDNDDKWGMLAKKVKAAMVFSSLANRKQPITSPSSRQCC